MKRAEFQHELRRRAALDRVTFGRLLADAARRLGVSHSELARRMGVVQNRIPAMFASPSITERTFRRAASALGVEIEVKLRKRRSRK